MQEHNFLQFIVFQRKNRFSVQFVPRNVPYKTTTIFFSIFSAAVVKAAPALAYRAAAPAVYAHAAPVAYAHAAPAVYAHHATPVAYAHAAPAVYHAAPVAKAVVAAEPFDAHPQYNFGYSVSPQFYSLYIAPRLNEWAHF